MNRPPPAGGWTPGDPCEVCGTPGLVLQPIDIGDDLTNNVCSSCKWRMQEQFASIKEEQGEDRDRAFFRAGIRVIRGGKR